MDFHINNSLNDHLRLISMAETRTSLLHRALVESRTPPSGEGRGLQDSASAAIVSLLKERLGYAPTYCLKPAISHVVEVASQQLETQVEEDPEIPLVLQPHFVPSKDGFATCHFPQTGLEVVPIHEKEEVGPQPLVIEGFAWFAGNLGKFIDERELPEGFVAVLFSRPAYSWIEEDGREMVLTPGTFLAEYAKSRALFPTGLSAWVLEDGVYRLSPEVERSQRSSVFDYLIYSFFHFIQGRVSVQKASRPLRRRAERMGRDAEYGDIRVVRLRKTETDRGEKDPGFEEPSIEWTHRWVVSGHWRNQWYPSTQSHSLIWIDPHVKGPEDKPIIYKDQVYLVER